MGSLEGSSGKDCLEAGERCGGADLRHLPAETCITMELEKHPWAMEDTYKFE